MVSMILFVMAFAGLFLVYGQTVRMLDSLRQTSRAEDIALSNIEFLRTRSWDQVTNVFTNSIGSDNLAEATNAVETNSPIYSTLTLVSSDPLGIGLKNASRNMYVQPWPTTSTAEPIRKATVTVVWKTMDNRTVSNNMTVYITKGGMTADVVQ